MKMTIEIYGQFLLSSQINYTCTYLSEHLEGVTHDNVNYFLKTTKLSPRQLWKTVRSEIVLSVNGYIIFDDTVLSKIYSQKISLVRKQYSGNVHGIIKGIGVVNCLYYNPDLDRYWLIDYRIFAPDLDGKSKLDHVMDMLDLLSVREISYYYVLMDSWYASVEVLKYLIENNKIFYCPLKSNRKIDDSGGKEAYKQIQECFWTDQDVAQGKQVKVQKMPKDTYFRLFRVLVTTTRTDYIVTNDLTQQDTKAAEKQSSFRWKIEQLHREEKQTTGIDACQCRNAQAQKNHITIACLVWNRLRVFAYQCQTSVYAIKKSLLDEYMKSQMKKPTFKFA
jgi:hypothetical protein